MRHGNRGIDQSGNTAIILGRQIRGSRSEQFVQGPPVAQDVDDKSGTIQLGRGWSGRLEESGLWFLSQERECRTEPIRRHAVKNKMDAYPVQ